MKQKILVSVDTEGPAGKHPVERLIYGKTADGEFGIKYLMRLFDQHGAKGLFFVDIAEAWDYGRNRIEDVLHTVTQGGHDTGVHVHPEHMADKNRRYLWQYSYEEQYEMIARCTEIYCKSLKKFPLSFRAGRYSANNDTMAVLSKLGYKYDMSSFYGNRYCKLRLPCSYNKMISIDKLDLKEVPVTSFKSFENYFYRRFDKIDCSMDFREFKRVMEKIFVLDSVDVVSFFVHSFSVLDWRRQPDRPKLSRKYNRRLLEELDWLSDHRHTRFISEADLDGIKCCHASGGGRKKRMFCLIFLMR